MTSKPILFSGPMIAAILAGDKTQTRRIMKPQPTGPVNDITWRNDGWYYDTGNNCYFRMKACPYGKAGDSQLLVRETHYLFGQWKRNGKAKSGKTRWHFVANRELGAMYPGDSTLPIVCTKRSQVGWFKRPSIFMPRWASRITLEVTEIRAQRLQDISHEDAGAEGIALVKESERNNLNLVTWGEMPRDGYIGVFHKLWDSINASRAPWESNPWVYCLTFKEMKP